MAYVSETPRAVAGLSTGWFSDLAASFKLYRVRRAAFLETYRDLSAMSLRELDDIGLSRAMVRDVAKEAAARITVN